jgi:hypothetical protein
MKSSQQSLNATQVGSHWQGPLMSKPCNAPQPISAQVVGGDAGSSVDVTATEVVSIGTAVVGTVVGLAAVVTIC